jgi:hypothetical protein
MMSNLWKSIINYRRFLMGHLRCIGLLTAVLPIVLVLSAGASPAGATINFSSLDKNQSFKVSGTLYPIFPKQTSQAGVSGIQ